MTTSFARLVRAVSASVVLAVVFGLLAAAPASAAGSADPSTACPPNLPGCVEPEQLHLVGPVATDLSYNPA